MLVAIPKVLAPEQLAACTARLAEARWADGRESAGYLSQPVKSNSQLADTDPLARELRLGHEAVLAELAHAVRVVSGLHARVHASPRSSAAGQAG